jgi:hypothetical protein
MSLNHCKCLVFRVLKEKEAEGREKHLVLGVQS